MARGASFHFDFEPAHHVRAGGEELGFILLAAAEGYVVIGIFRGTLVPVGAHAVEYLGVVHLAVVILTSWLFSFGKSVVRRWWRSMPPRRMRR
jgi:hypothetical protein